MMFPHDFESNISGRVSQEYQAADTDELHCGDGTGGRSHLLFIGQLLASNYQWSFNYTVM